MVLFWIEGGQAAVPLVAGRRGQRTDPSPPMSVAGEKAGRQTNSTSCRIWLMALFWSSCCQARICWNF